MTIRSGKSWRFGAAVAVAIGCSLVPGLAAQTPSPQTPAAPPRPVFAGTWTPADPDRSDTLFDVGLTAAPGGTRMTIEQRGNRFSVTLSLPEDKLETMLDFTGRFYPTIIYRVYDSRMPRGGRGAGPVPSPEVTMWVGDRLVIPNARAAARPVTWTYSMDGVRLKLETTVDVGGGRVNHVTQLFTRVE